ncbi:inorganic pyrophosphatase [Penicillium pulvis]|uniref:inorganic pyrophosphatase n=1 Tax=Penicillium pulvis TaxID=1562058 RepID=UPI002546BC89|nr:inorganic pyrophosphatase [Penicillium pulvis]KAJ5813525.1 inorganic pyrophosphatase [Penicillium pulvis]
MSSSFEIETLQISESGEDCLFFKSNGQQISPWHDIPLFTDDKCEILNMIISKGDRYNPIKQDISNGRPRQLADIAPFQGYPCNYGALPQTWEDPNFIDTHTRLGGDDDPLDVCEIGSALGACGQVKKIKPLGAFALLDEGQTDWKIVAVDIGDPLANELSDISDVERYLPGFLDSLKGWYCRYKVPEGKGENRLGLDGELMSRQ